MKKSFLLFIFFLLGLQLAAAQIPEINSYVTDNSGILSGAVKSELENGLRDLEKLANGVQFVVFIEN